MIFFHYTNCLDTGTILTEGLKPGLNGNKREVESLPPHGVVWLTASGRLDDWSLKVPLAMIELVIPSRDRKLMLWRKWARKHTPDIIESLMNCDCGRDHLPSLRDHYVYFGTIQPSAFCAVFRLKDFGGGAAQYERIAARDQESL